VKPAYFAYDSADVRDRFRDAVSSIADCMKNGALKGRKLMLVGHADPRGEPDYNLSLGGRRADSVRQAIGAFGAPQGSMDVSSRGEVDARGSDTESWAKDRRVDIKLQPGSG
jgi:peptidoglycan-associated lipoprotein